MYKNIYLTILLLLSAIWTQQIMAQGVGYNPFPSSFTNNTTTSCLSGSSNGTMDVYFDFYKGGVTDDGGMGAGVSCEVYLRGSDFMRDPVLSNATPIASTLSAFYIGDAVNNDRYQATVPTGLPNGRYSWECKCSHGGTDYYSWDYGTNSGNSLQYFTVGAAGIYRSMAILDAGSGNTYYDMYKFQPGNTDLPTTIAGPNGNDGFCTSDPLTLVGAEFNFYKNNWHGLSGNICGGTLHVEVEVDSYTGTGCTVGASTANSLAVGFRDNCSFGYVNTFSFGGSCQQQDGNSLDQRWENVAANIDLMAMATSVCNPNTTTGDVTYNLKFYTETTMDCSGGCTLVQREPAVGYYTTQFTINGDADGTGGCPGQLPVELSLFTAQHKGGNNILDWSTVTEINADYFAIERSYNGSDFETIGWVDAIGESQNIVSYAYTDIHVRTGEYLYRLKMVDLDGSYEYSEIKSIQVDENGVPTLSVQPNPSSSMIQISTTGLKDQYHIRIFDAQGKEVLATQKNQFNLSHLSRGIYLVSISDGEHHLIEKLILQ